MKYYVTADIHGFLSLFQEALKESGYYEDNSEKKIIICGDLFDRGEEAEKLQDYILSLMEKNEVMGTVNTKGSVPNSGLMQTFLHTTHPGL